MVALFLLIQLYILKGLLQFLRVIFLVEGYIIVK
jgi:hypothetical protein